MDKTVKLEMYNKAKGHVNHVRERVQGVLAQVEANIIKGKETMKTLIRSGQAADQMVQMALSAYDKKRAQELVLLHPSPYFVCCEILLEQKEKQILYFAKFPFSEESIYSWVAPAAAIRFEKPGSISYIRPDGSRATGILTRRDQYMIVNGQIVFFATESTDSPRELVYQEHFSTRKTGFVLPEIVEQMEKAQDMVIRAHHRGPFVISGPAGSGKTTLALHRVAYLVQAPDTMEHFKSSEIMVFVQDDGTKEYFSHLLPELGITDVTITTFSDWAKQILGLTDKTFVLRYGATESEKDLYEWQKLQAFREAVIPPYTKLTFEFLEQLYAPFLSADTSKLFLQQKKNNVVDRFDLTILLQAYQKKHSRLDMEREYFVKQKNSEVLRKKKRFPLEYSLIVVDEFQNYLPEQLQLVRGCASPATASMVYVGDMAQQIHLGTIRGWQEIDESIKDDRSVMLHKVYRNTKNILQYIQSLGYMIAIPEEIKSGVPVAEMVCATRDAEIEYIKQLASNPDIGSIGVLAKDDSYLSGLRELFVEDKRIHVLSMTDAQGVEFDTVCLTGLRPETFFISKDISAQFIKQKMRIQKDLLYVALTRAINELHVLGSAKLSALALEWDFIA